MEWMSYYEDTSQWGLKYDIERFENDEIIHFAEPSKRGGVWGESLIDALAEYLTLQVYGLKFNRNVLYVCFKKMQLNFDRGRIYGL